MPAEVPDKTPIPTKPVVDPAGLQNFLTAGMGSDIAHNRAAMGAGPLGTTVALGSGKTGKKSIFGSRDVTG